MPTSTWSVDISRSPTEVFAYLADIGRHSEWSPKPFRVEGVDGAVAVGSRFRSFGHLPMDKNEHVNDVEVTEFSPSSSFTLESREKGEVFINRFVVTATEAGSRVERTMEFPKLGGVMGAMFPVLLATVIRPGVQKGMNMLRDRLEQGAGVPV